MSTNQDTNAHDARRDIRKNIELYDRDPKDEFYTSIKDWVYHQIPLYYALIAFVIGLILG